MEIQLRLLQTALALPLSKVLNVKPYPLPLGTREGIAEVIQELKEKGIVAQIRSSYSLLMWPVSKPNRRRCLTRLSSLACESFAAARNTAKLASTIREQAHLVLARINV